MKNLKFITIGSDPEFFIQDEVGTPISSIIIAEGTKKSPKYIGDGFYVLRDNLALEGNVPIATNREDFINNIKHLKNYFNLKLEEYGCRLLLVGEVEFEEYIAHSEEGLEFGCSNVVYAWQNRYFSSENILDIATKPSPQLIDSNIRTAGFHIHIGYTIKNPHFMKEMYDTLVARLFDLFIVLPSLQIKREEYRVLNYGLLGNYRSTSYGLECRALSAFFTDDKYLGWIYDQVVKLFEYINTLEIEDINRILDISTYIDTTPEEVFSLLQKSIPDLNIKIDNEILILQTELKQYEEIYN